MNGEIYLIRTAAEKIVPALCLKQEKSIYSFAQIRSSSKEEEITPLFQNDIKESSIQSIKAKTKRKMIKAEEGKNAKKIRVDSVYIGHPTGLKSPSIVMIKKIHQIKKEAIIKYLAKIEVEDFRKCNEVYSEINRISDLHKKLHKIKKKILLAQFNNEKYGELEKQRDQILKEIGYTKNPLFKKEKKPFLNFREVPDKGRIKVYKGGR